FVYTINTKPGLIPGTSIKNRVGIYFDANPVVLTNTVENIIGCPGTLGIQSNSNKFAIYPNPAGSTLYLSGSENIENVVISNIVGQVVYSGIF
uniref:DUF7619 domain-containing protein n=1 Tax=Escherichia coli TaxID=562 RepID=UPI001E5FB894